MKTPKAGVSSVYKLTLDNGARCQVEATSAAQAIEEAIWLNRGRTVVGCYAGMTEEDARDHNERRLKIQNPEDRPPPAMIGIVDFFGEITPHEPIPFDAVRPKPKRPKDTTESLFSEDDVGRIKIESRTAKHRAEFSAGSSTFTP